MKSIEELMIEELNTRIEKQNQLILILFHKLFPNEEENTEEIRDIIRDLESNN